MYLCTMRELQTTPNAVPKKLTPDSGVVVTDNGRPSALLINIRDGLFEETASTVRQTKAMFAFNLMRKQAV